MKTTEQLNKLLIIEKDFLSLLKDKEPLFSIFNDSEKYNLVFLLIEKIVSIQDSILTNKTNIFELSASLRYVLETLIQTELLLLEPNYTYKLIYSIFDEHIRRIEKFIERMKFEIELMESFEIEDQKILKTLIEDANKGKFNKKTTIDYTEATRKLDEKADLNITFFTRHYRWNGYGLEKSIVSTKLLPEYQAKLHELKKEKKEKIKEIIRAEKLSNNHGIIKTYNSAIIELKEKRKWKEKAIITDLEKEYDLVYQFTSELLHSTSYSLFTNNYLTEYENELFLSLIYQYSKKIMKNINEYSKIDFISSFLESE